MRMTRRFEDVPNVGDNTLDTLARLEIDRLFRTATARDDEIEVIGACFPGAYRVADASTLRRLAEARLVEGHVPVPTLQGRHLIATACEQFRCRRGKRTGQEPCRHPNHEPPKHMVFPAGGYKHTCPGCGSVTHVRNERPTL